MYATNPHKTLVTVRAEHHTDGRIQPLFFVMPNGEKVKIERIMRVQQAASLKAGGQGIRYEVRVCSGAQRHQLYLFDDAGIWFIETPQPTHSCYEL